ncbi:MAG: hypothetical protein B7X78_00845 [Sphingomonadales bacterium 39-62-4]|nr:MAG: hypothetical protein B7X78_00845 [Sphingomonadales bacterium 39-62-4]
MMGKMPAQLRALLGQNQLSAFKADTSALQAVGDILDVSASTFSVNSLRRVPIVSHERLAKVKICIALPN